MCGLPTLTFGSLNNLGQPGSLPSNKASDITQVSDNLTISRNHHVLRTGVLWENIAYPTSSALRRLVVRSGSVVSTHQW